MKKLFILFFILSSIFIYSQNNKAGLKKFGNDDVLRRARDYEALDDYYDAGLCYLELKNDKKAQQSFEKGAKQSETEKDYYATAKCYELLQNYDSALKFYIKTSQSSNTPVINNIIIVNCAKNEMKDGFVPLLTKGALVQKGNDELHFIKKLTSDQILVKIINLKLLKYNSNEKLYKNKIDSLLKLKYTSKRNIYKIDTVKNSIKVNQSICYDENGVLLSSISGENSVEAEINGESLYEEYLNWFKEHTNN